jgi:hypothetical protein
MSKDILSSLELTMLQVAKYYKSFQWGLLQTILANREQKGIISKGYFIYCSDFGLRSSLEGIQCVIDCTGSSNTCPHQPEH